MELVLTEDLLDLTKLELEQRNPEILTKLEALPGGEQVIIETCFDPGSLYNRLLGRRGERYSWQSLEQGPSRWRVRVLKQEIERSDETIGQIAARDLRLVRIFKKYDLDYCCGGRKTLKQACAEKGIDINKVIHDLQSEESGGSNRSLPCNNWDLDFLCEYIVNTHHAYVRAALPELEEVAKKVAEVHGHEQPELGQVYHIVKEIVLEMTAHMMKEEMVVFPYIKSLANSGNETVFHEHPGIESSSQPIELMETEHEEVGAQIHEIIRLTNNFTLPENACTSHKYLYRLLEEFTQDLYMHIHLENNILFEKAAKLEKLNNEKP